MSALHKSNAIILSAIRWHDSSKIITLYAREWGKIKVIAKGALRRTSPFGGKLETLNLVEAVISRKSSRSLQILTDVTLLNSFDDLKARLEHLPYALAMLELIQAIFEEQQSEPVFFDFLVTLIDQMQTASQPRVIFWYFLLKLSSFLGFKPQLDRCASCNREITAGTVYFSQPNGFVVCSECAGQGAGLRKLTESDYFFLKRLQSFPHRRINHLAPPETSQCDFTHLLMDYLNHHLGRQVEVKSLRLLGV